MDGNFHEDDEGFFSFDDFRDCLDGLEKFQSCNHEADAEDQIQRLKMELRFLRTFSKCIARDENLKSSLEAAVSSDFTSLFSSSEDEMSHISSALQVFVEMRSKVSCFYDQISVTSPSYIPMTNELVVELINDLMQNLEDLLLLSSSEVNWVVNVNINIKNQISDLRQRLQFLKKFLDFVLARPQCCEHEKFKKLLARGEAKAIGAARVSYSCFANQSTEESAFEIEQRLSNLLEKIKPSNSELREMYIGVMEATKSSESSDKIGLGPFLDFLHELLLEIPALDQLKVLDAELRFIRALLIDPPGKEYTGPENLNDLLRSIESLTTKLGSLVFSLYTDEMTDDLTTQMNFVMVNLLEKMKYVKFKGREIYLNASKPSRSKVPKTDGLGFIEFLLENLEELLSHGDNNTIALLKHHIKTVQQEFKSLIPLLKKMEKQIKQHEKFKSLWIRAIDVAYHAEYIIDSFVMKDCPPWYYMFCLDDLVDELLQVKAGVVDINNSQVPYDTGVHSNDETNDSSGALFSLANSPTASTNVQLVGFEDVVEKITDLLTKGCGEQLDIISIVGMPGLDHGKETRIFFLGRLQSFKTEL